jgi:hypothetical protein
MRRRYRVMCPATSPYRAQRPGTTHVRDSYLTYCSFDSYRMADSPEQACEKPCPQCKRDTVLIHPGDPAWHEWSERQMLR